MKRIAITISREYGAGGHTIGKQVAQELGIELYDRDIVRETARASGYAAETVQEEEEEVSRGSAILNSILSNSVHFPNTQDAIHEVQQALILQYAKAGPCVILGRCADEVLRSSGIPCLNVFIHASEIHRAERMKAETGITDATELQRLITRKDHLRRNYYNHYTGRQWGDSHNYHLTLDSGVLGDELCARIIISAAREIP